LTWIWCIVTKIFSCVYSQNLEVEDTNNVVVGKEIEDEGADKKKDNEELQQQQQQQKERQLYYSPSIPRSYMSSWHDYVNAGFKCI
jgi:hypothetical protein